MRTIKIKILLFGISIGFLMPVLSQPYQSILSVDTCKWNVYEMIPDGGSNILYMINSDTTINAKKYFILRRAELRRPGVSMIYNYDYWGYIREDTVNGKYWWLDQEEKYDESLFMDLGLEKGDKFYFIWNYEFPVGDSILVDSVYYENGKKIIEFSYLLDFMKLKFIEGVGPNIGFCISENNFWDSYTLLCKYDNDELVYSTEANKSGNCYIDPFVGLKENTSINDIEIYPNPASGLVNVHLNNLPIQNYQLHIYNSTGTCLLSQKLSDSITKLELAQKGLYIIVISDGNQIYTKKIINR